MSLQQKCHHREEDMHQTTISPHRRNHRQAQSVYAMHATDQANVRIATVKVYGTPIPTDTKYRVTRATGLESATPATAQVIIDLTNRKII